MQSIQTSGRTLHFNEHRSLEMASKPKHVVIFSRIGDQDTMNRCLACGMEYQTFKEAVECCVGTE